MSFAVHDDTLAIAMVFAVLLAVLGAATWVYRDSKSQCDAGRPVTTTLGPLQLNTPTAWFLACLLMPEVIVPTYVDTRTYA